MKWQLFENKIRKNLSNHSSEFDLEELWGSLESEVDAINNRKKKRRGFIWFFFGGLLVVAVGSLFFFSPFDESNSHEFIASEINETELENEVTKVTNSKIKNIGKSVNDSKLVDYDERAALGENVELKAKAVTTASKKINNQLSLTNENLKKSGETLISKGVKIDKSETDFDIEKPTLEGEKITEKANEGITDETILEQNLESELGGKKSEIVEETKYENVVTEVEENLIDNVIGGDDLIPPNENDENKKKPFKFAFSVQGSISFTDRILEEKDSVIGNLRALRDLSERSLETSQLGLRLTMEHESGWNLTSGINYTQINEKFRYTESVTTTDSVPGIQFFVQNLENELDTIFGPVPLTTTTTFNKKYYNKFRMIEVPILIGWSTKIRKVRVGTQAGIFANISTKSVGNILKNESEDIDVEETDVYKTNVGLSYYFGVSAAYPLRDGFEIYASPFARIFPKSFTLDRYELSQKYRLYGVNVGVKWRF